MKPDLEAVAFWDEELAALDAKATEIFGEESVLAVIERVRPPAGAMTLANVMRYRNAVKAELRRMVRPQ